MSFLLLILLLLFSALFLIVLGTLGLSGLNALLKPKWFGPISGTLKTISLAWLPLTAVFALVLILQKNIFPWTTQDLSSTPFRAYYFSEPFFALRGALYLLMSGFMLYLMHRGSRIYAALSLVLILFFGSFASYDWILSQSEFHSTIFGLLMIVNGCLIVHALALSKIDSLTEASLLQDLNTIHLALIALWSYLALMQFLTVWSGNLPVEVSYFKDRFHGLMGTLAAVCLGGQTLIPIPLLLFRNLKAKPSFTRGIAYYTLAMQSLHLFWLSGGVR